MNSGISSVVSRLESIGKTMCQVLQCILCILLCVGAGAGIVTSFIFLCYHEFSFQWYGVGESSFYRQLFSFNQMLYSLNHAPGVNWKILASLHMGVILYYMFGGPLIDYEDGDQVGFGWVMFACSTWIFPWLFMFMILGVTIIFIVSVCVYLARQLLKNVRP